MSNVGRALRATEPGSGAEPRFSPGEARRRARRAREGPERVLTSKPMLDEAAMAAVRQWRYTPTLLNGVPVPVLMTITIRFTLN